MVLKKYKLPKGYSYVKTLLKSFNFLKYPIKFICLSMDKFSGTYSAKMFNGNPIILTQDAEFIEYVLRSNHANYPKSEINTKRAAEFLGRGLLFNLGEDWLRQRRLIQPGFHKERIQLLNKNIIKTIDTFLTDFPEGDKIDVYPLMHELTFNVVINSLFEVHVSKSDILEMSRAFSQVQKFIFEEPNYPFQKFLYPITGKEKKALLNAKKIKTILKKLVDRRISENA